MFCINCFNKTTIVANSRPRKNYPAIWRRRHCEKCNRTFTTYERPSLRDNTLVTLPSGKSEPFNLGKLILSIARAFDHNEHDAKYNSMWLAQTVEDTLSTQLAVITPEDIEAVTHQALKRYDEVAAMQYAAKQRLITSARRRGRPSLVWHEPPNDG